MRLAVVRGGTLSLALGACACPTKPVVVGARPGGTHAAPGASPCDPARPRIEQLYRAEAQVAEPRRVEAAVADNTAMVLAVCAQDVDAIRACVERVATATELETTCLPRLEDDGREADVLAR